MSLSRNELSGEIPPELGQLENLQRLSLSDNAELGGTLTDGLAAVEDLDIAGTQIRLP